MNLIKLDNSPHELGLTIFPEGYFATSDSFVVDMMIIAMGAIAHD